MTDYNLNIRSDNNEIAITIGEHYNQNMIITKVGTLVLM